MIYIDSEYKCHASNPDGTFREVKTNCFNGKCNTFIEGYRFIPDGESWVDENGVVFEGIMIAPWKSYDEMDAAQREYEKQLLAEYAEALAILGVEV